jgi:Bacterial Ig-like domain (group 1)
MLRLLLLTIVGFGLLWGGPTPAEMRLARTGSTSAGYSFSTDLTYPIIYVYPSGQAEPGTEAATRFPPSTTLTVSVKDAAGNPVAGVPVAFEVPQNSMLSGMLDINPQYETTDADGKVHATITPSPTATRGTGDVIVRVDDKIETVGVTLDMSRIRPTP